MPEIFDKQLQWKALRVLTRLCKTTHDLPQSLFLENIHLVTQDAVVGGGYADIYMGYHCGQYVALKHLRVFASDEARENIQWVCDMLSSHLHDFI